MKLHSAWDRRTVVSGSWKLSACDGFDRVFIRPDEPVDIRRRKSLDRLMKKASEEGRQVSLANGVLYIDNKNVFRWSMVSTDRSMETMMHNNLKRLCPLTAEVLMSLSNVTFVAF